MQPHKKLNLLAFPPETNALFILLMFASIMLSFHQGTIFGGILEILFGIDIFSIDRGKFGVDAALDIIPTICLSGFSLFIAIGAALFLYSRMPSQIRKRRKIMKVGERDYALHNEVHGLAAQAGVPTPLIEISPGLKGTDAQAFDTHTPFSLALDGGFRVLRKTRPALFEALIRHELAHIASKDIVKSYFSAALWNSIRWTLMPLAVVGIAGILFVSLISSILDGDLLGFLLHSVPAFMKLVFEFLFIAALTGIIWTRLLRTREYYADWMAVLWGSEDGLRAILNENAQKEKPVLPMKNLWANHPSSSQRIDALNQPILLFSLSGVLVFFTGLLLAFISAGINTEIGVSSILLSFISEMRDASSGLLFWLFRFTSWGILLFTALIIFIPIAWLLNSTLLSQIQKQAAVDLVDNRRGLIPYLKFVFPALLLTSGIGLGSFVTPASQGLPNGAFIDLFLLFLFLIILAWGYFCFIRFVALRLMASQIGPKYSVWRDRFLGTISAFWAFLFFIPGLLVSLNFWSSTFQRELGLFTWPISLGWALFAVFIGFTTLVSPVFFITIWGGMKILFDLQPQKCYRCGKITNHTFPAIKHCQYCHSSLGEWLFIIAK